MALGWGRWGDLGDLWLEETLHKGHGWNMAVLLAHPPENVARDTKLFFLCVGGF